MTSVLRALCLPLLTLLTCSHPVPLAFSDRPSPSPVAEGSGAGAGAGSEKPPHPAELAPLEGDGPFLRLPVDGFAPALVSVPLGAWGRRPVVIATHGNYDHPESQCEVWRGIVGDRAFVLCPRGVARTDSPSREDVRFTYASNQDLERETLAALAALRARFPEHVDTHEPLYAGYSLGSFMGTSVAIRHPAELPRLVLTEGGHDTWTAEGAAAFAKGGGERVLFICSQPACAIEAKRAANHLAAAGVATRVVSGPNVGHRYDGATAETTKRVFGWALEGDARWDDVR